MSQLRYKKWTWASVAIFSSAYAAIAAYDPAPRFIWNGSASAAMGLYYIDRSANPSRGELVAYQPPPAISRFMNDRRYLPLGLPLIKKVAAGPGERVCRWADIITINDQPAAIAYKHDRRGRKLPTWYGCRQVNWNQLFLLNAAPDSLDGRYFGIMPAAGVIGGAHPILTRDAPAAPLRWRGRPHHRFFP